VSVAEKDGTVKKSGKGFFASTAILMTLIVVLSFPLTYYLPVINASRQFDILHHAHGLAFFAWFGLYVWQTQLVFKGKLARHREIGLSGLVLTGAMLPLGYWMAQRAAEVRAANDLPRPYEFSWYNFADMGLFTGFMIAAVVLVTRHKEWHRRLVYTAALSLMAPAATRWTLKLTYVDPFVLDILVYFVVYPFLIALVFHDRKHLGKVHPATLASFAVLLPVHLTGAWIARSDWWNEIAPWLLGPPSI